MALRRNDIGFTLFVAASMLITGGIASGHNTAATVPVPVRTRHSRIAVPTVAQQSTIGTQMVVERGNPYPGPTPSPPSITATPRDSRVVLKWLPVRGAVKYSISRSVKQASGYEALSVVPSNAAARYIDVGLHNDVTYYYRIAALSQSTRTIKTLTSSAKPELPPVAPTNLKATPGNEQVELTWTENDVRATSFTVKRSKSSGGPYLDLATIPNDPERGADPMMFEDTGQMPMDMDTMGLFVNGSTYYYIITANDPAGSSQPSEEVKVTPTLPIPGTPDSISADPGDHSVAITWDLSEDATSINIYRSENGGPFTLIKSESVYDSRDGYTDTGLTNSVTYSYYLKGANKTGESAPSPTATATPYSAKFTADQAVKIARDFCTAVGQTVTSTPTAVFPAPRALPDAQEYNYEPRWQITFPGQAELDVVDGSNRVVSYMNDFDEESQSGLDVPAGKAEAKDKAAATFASVLKASGVDVSELGTPDLREDQNGYPATELTHDWMIDDPRLFHGIPYKDQGCMAMIQAETGRLGTFSVGFRSPPPTEYDVVQSKQQAEDAAASELAAKWKGSAVKCSGAELIVVQPNTLFKDSEEPVPGPAVVVWDCVFSPKPGLTIEVWINAKDASPEGGAVMQLH